MDIQLRKATIKDLEFLFNLRNEEAVRRVSFSTDLISLETHKNWLEKKLSGSDSILFIAEENSCPIAQVRFDWLDGSAAEVNIAVAGGFRGRGYGSEILRKAALIFLSEFPRCNIISAFIKPDNKASIRSFEKAGYRYRAQVRHKEQMCMEMVLTR